jgi:hypothetical protein
MPLVMKQSDRQLWYTSILQNAILNPTPVAATLALWVLVTPASSIANFRGFADANYRALLDASLSA